MMNFTSPLKSNYNELENNFYNDITKSIYNPDHKIKKNIDFLLFHSQVQNFLKLQGSTEEILQDYQLRSDIQNFLINKIEKTRSQEKNDYNFFPDLFFFKKNFESKKFLIKKEIFINNYSKIFENFIQNFFVLFNCQNCQKLFIINASCKCIGEEGNNNIIYFTENLICVLNFMNYKEKIFQEKINQLYKKNEEFFSNFNNQLLNQQNLASNQNYINDYELKFNSNDTGIYNSNNKQNYIESKNKNKVFPTEKNIQNNSSINFSEAKQNLFVRNEEKQKLFDSLLVKFNSELSLIIKIYLKCLLINFKFNNQKITSIKPEIKELIFNCKINKIVETFLMLIIKDEIKFEIDTLSNFYDKPYLEEIYKYKYFKFLG